MTILHANIDEQSRRLISELPVGGIMCIERLQSHCANMNFSDKIKYDSTSHQVTHKEGGSEINYIMIFQTCTGFISFSRKFRLRISTDAHISGLLFPRLKIILIR